METSINIIPGLHIDSNSGGNMEQMKSSVPCKDFQYSELLIGQKILRFLTAIDFNSFFIFFIAFYWTKSEMFDFSRKA